MNRALMQKLDNESLLTLQERGAIEIEPMPDRFKVRILAPGFTVSSNGTLHVSRSFTLEVDLPSAYPLQRPRISVSHDCLPPFHPYFSWPPLVLTSFEWYSRLMMEIPWSRPLWQSVWHDFWPHNPDLPLGEVLMRVIRALSFNPDDVHQLPADAPRPVNRRALELYRNPIYRQELQFPSMHSHRAHELEMNSITDIKHQNQANPSQASFPSPQTDSPRNVHFQIKSSYQPPFKKPQTLAEPGYQEGFDRKFKNFDRLDKGSGDRSRTGGKLTFFGQETRQLQEEATQSQPRFRVVSVDGPSIMEQEPPPEGQIIVKTKLEEPLTPSHRLYISSAAMKSILKHIGWGRQTENNFNEQGGLLLGRAFQTQNGLTFAIVDTVVVAHSAQGSPVYLRMDHNTWKQMLDAIDAMENPTGQLRVVGWYHTHPGRLRVFMSGTDQETQRKFFQNDWQFAVVLNPHQRIWRVFSGPDCVERQGLVFKSA